MVIGVVIPHKKDRPAFLTHCLDMLERQTIPPDFIRLVDEDSGIQGCDITWRYRKGFETIFGQYDCDVCFLWEDDDNYRNDYIEVMLKNWEANGRSELFGIGNTVYYHIGLKKYKRLIHPKRSSAFCTMVTKEVMNIKFPPDTEPFFDIHLWRQMEGKTFIPKEQICLGIKHGVGLCGGKAHNDNFPYDIDDTEGVYLKSVVDAKSFNFYRSL